MRKILIVAVCIVAVCALSFSIVAYAHSGKTDSNGGHWNHATGEYHYHHGYSAHQHYDMDGDGDSDCPYNFEDKTNHGNSSTNDWEYDTPTTSITNNDTENTDTKAKISVKSILKKIFSIIGLSILTGLVGVSSGILIILYFLLMLPVEAVIKRCCKNDSQEKILERFGVSVKVIMAIAIVVIIANIVTT